MNNIILSMKRNGISKLKRRSERRNSTCTVFKADSCTTVFRGSKILTAMSRENIQIKKSM
jgi:hypothetical protein